MDFEELKRIPLGDVASTIIQEGGAVVAGLGVAGVAGRQVENLLMGATPVSPTSTTFDKGKAWAANNVPKIILYKLLRGKTGVYEDAKKGVVTSVAFDTLMRLTNAGVNPASATIMGYQVLGDGSITGITGAGADAGAVQKLVQENSALRNEIARMKAGVQGQIQGSGAGPMDPRLPPYVGSSQVVPPAERERKFAFMQPSIPGITKPPGQVDREKRYGFASGTPDMSAMTVGRPGAAYVQAGKMFGMQ